MQKHTTCDLRPKPLPCQCTVMNSSLELDNITCDSAQKELYFYVESSTSPNILGIIVFSGVLAVVLASMGSEGRRVIQVISILNDAVLKLVNLIMMLDCHAPPALVDVDMYHIRTTYCTPHPHYVLHPPSTLCTAPPIHTMYCTPHPHYVLHPPSTPHTAPSIHTTYCIDCYLMWPTCLVSTLKGTPNLYYLSEVVAITTG